MTDLDFLFKKLSSSRELKDFKGKNKDAFLYACFFVTEGNWQFDYYNPKDNLITTFEVSDVIKVMPVDRVFGVGKPKVSALHIDKVKVDFDSTMELVKKFVASQYPGDNFFTKAIVILQNFEDKTIWNVTFLTSTLKLLNVKLDVSSGKILSHSVESFLSMK